MTVGAAAPVETTNLASSGVDSACASTNSPRSFSSALTSFWNLMWASIASGVHSLITGTSSRSIPP